ncbi:MAG TPA: ABC transporter permease [Chthoniobacterales bacterium]
MKKPFSLFLALRYLKPKRTFVSIITVITILGVTLAIAALIVVISVMRGFELELQRKILGFEAHIIVTNGHLLENWKQIAKEVQSVPGVEAVAPYTLGRVLAEANHQRIAPLVRGIDPEKECHITDIEKYLVASDSVVDGKNKLDLDGDNCVIGSYIADNLGISVGDKLNLTSPKNTDELLRVLDQAQKDGNKDPKIFDQIKQLVLPTELTVTGIFNSGRYEYDSDFVLVPLYIGQEMYGLEGNEVHGLAVRTNDPFAVGKTKRAIMAKIGPANPDDMGPQNLALTWIDQNKELLDSIGMERVVMFFILMIIMVVAAFSIMNTLITLTVQKTREIGVLKALGASTMQIVSIFLVHGMIVGFFGTLTGLALGTTLIRFRNETRDLLSNLFGFRVFPETIYQFPTIPAQVVASDVIVICVSAFVISSVAALIPAFIAARLDPVKALRYE